MATPLEIAVPTCQKMVPKLRMKTLLLVPVVVLAFAGCGGGAPAATDGSGGPETDATPPSTPAALTAAPVGSTGANLSWHPSMDNVAVTGYIVRRNGTQLGTSVATNFADSGLLGGTTYSYSVAASDAAGNVSAPASASVTTASASGDTTPPIEPASLVATAVGEGQINLTWSASNDNVGVTGYRLERCAGVACTTNFAQISTPSALTYSDTSSLVPSTTYGYQVRATDGAGNLSGFSSIAYATTQAATGATLPLGSLAHDGPATPEQISLILPVTGSLPQTATATVRYKPTSSPTWITGHPLYRIRPAFSLPANVGSVPDAFAWPIIDVAPGTSYQVEVTVTSGAVTNVKALTHTTRAMPAAAGVPNKTIAPGSTSAQIQVAFNSLVPGDVIEFDDGTYNVSGLVLNRSGTVSSPIYIRGQSRAGVVLSNASRVLQIQNASQVIIENMTMRGSGVDSGTAASSGGIGFLDGSPTQTRITVRNITMTGVDWAIASNSEIAEFLAYDNTFTGNNVWTPAFIDSNLTWNDDGIRIPGFGNCAFNNTLKGFGDTMSYSQSPGVRPAQAIGVHFYRNDVLMGGDDGTEGDDGMRNITFYDNRLRNTMTFISLDPLFGGPFVGARNISINTGRGPFKFNNQNAGQFIYNNTIVRTNGATGWGWAQFDNGPQNAWGFRNNLMVYRGTGNLLAFEPGGNNVIDFTHNSWYPNTGVWWTKSGGSFGSIAAAYAGLPATTPVFSGATRRHEQDNITVSNPWTTTITLGPDYHTEVTVAYTPALSPGTAPENSGVVIPNITDGFAGGAPDRGAIIQGRPIPQYGDRSPP